MSPSSVRSGPRCRAEHSRQGQALEAGAQAVQAAVRDRAVIRPSYLRRQPHPSVNEAGVQRLGLDDDPYSWQGRSPDEQALANLPGTFAGLLGFGFIANSRAARAQRSASDEWARHFETEEARPLQGMRNERWDELFDARLRQRRNEAIRTEKRSASLSNLSRADHLELRAALDEEMPFEFGAPNGIDPYPTDLPADESVANEVQHEEGDEDVEAEGDEFRRHSGQRRAPVRRTSAADAQPERGTTVVDRALRRSGHRATGGQGEPDYSWQERGPTGSEGMTALFGDSILGSVLGKLAPDDRESAEADREDEIKEQRADRERELRHVVLRAKRTELLRAGGEQRGTIRLTKDEIIQIREQLDQQMPLEYLEPTYIDVGDDAGLDASGQFVSDAAASSEAEASTATGSSPQDARGGDDHDGRSKPVSTAPATGWAATEAAVAVEDHHASASADHDGRAAHRIFAAASELDMDVLTRRLYGRIRRELRSELLIDRERAGALADVC